MAFLTTFQKFVMTSNQVEFNEFYKSRFESEASIHIDLKINKNDAFIFIHPEIARKIAEIYALDKNVYESFESLPGLAQKQYIKKSFIDEITHTNEIEGVISTRK